MNPLRSLGRVLLQGRPKAGLALLGLAAAAIAVLLIEGTRPGIAQTPRIPHFDKLLHVGAHGLVTSLLAWGIALLRPLRSAQRPALAALSMDATAGLAVELVQLWLGKDQGRQFDWWDLAANLCGTFVATIAFLYVARAAASAYTGENRPG